MHPETHKLKGVKKRAKKTFVGKMMLQLSDNNEDMMWSAHLGGVIMSAWNTS